MGGPSPSPSPSGGSCPWANKCINSEGQCRACNKSPWYDTDGQRCVCGPGSGDWIHPGQCSACSYETNSTGVKNTSTVNSTKNVKPAHQVSSTGTCSPQGGTDCGYYGISEGECYNRGCSWCPGSRLYCQSSSGPSPSPSPSGGSCPWANKCINSEGQCRACNKSPWYDTDGQRCVCGPGSGDWIHPGQCSACSYSANSTVDKTGEIASLTIV